MIELTRDTTFKKIMKEKNGKKWFDSIIKDLLDIDLSEYDYYTETYPTGENSKHDFYTDIALKYGKDIVIVEMQNSKLGSDKSFYYLFRVAGFNMERGKSVGNKTTLIRFVNFYPNDIIKDKKARIIPMCYMNAEYKYVVDMIRGYDIVLPNFTKITYNKGVEKRMKMFNCKSYEEMKKFATTELDFWIIKRLQELERDEDFMIYYDEEIIKGMDENIIKDEIKKGREEGLAQGRVEGLKEGHAEGLKEGHAEGLKEGRIEGKKEVILNLKKLNMPIEKIASIVNMSIEEIKEAIN